MTTRCPPQQGHDGRGSSGSFGASSLGGGATSSSSRAKARLALRADANASNKIAALALKGDEGMLKGSRHSAELVVVAAFNLAGDKNQLGIRPVVHRP